MKIDLYTKAMLTIIAACLILLCVRDLQQPSIVRAQPDSLRVVITDVDPAKLPSGIPVNMKGGPGVMPVAIRSIDAQDAAIPVIVRGGGTDGRSPVSVRVTNVESTPVPVDVVRVAGTPVGQEGVPTTQSARHPAPTK